MYSYFCFSSDKNEVFLCCAWYADVRSTMFSLDISFYCCTACHLTISFDFLASYSSLSFVKSQSYLGLLCISENTICCTSFLCSVCLFVCIVSIPSLVTNLRGARLATALLTEVAACNIIIIIIIN